MGIRDTILAVKTSEPVKVDVPSWGVAVFVREITGAERDAFEESCVVKQGKKRVVSLNNIRAKLVALCACDADGAPIFAPADEQKLGNLPAKGLDTVFSVCQRVNGLSDADVEELAGN